MKQKIKDVFVLNYAVENRVRTTHMSRALNGEEDERVAFHHLINNCGCEAPQEDTSMSLDGDLSVPNERARQRSTGDTIFCK